MVAYVALLCNRTRCRRRRVGVVGERKEKRTLQALLVYIYRMHFEDGQVKISSSAGVRYRYQLRTSRK
jgi:hypothetical protein